MSWRALLLRVVAQTRHETVLGTPANTLSTRDRLAVLLDEGEARRASLLRERVIVSGLPGRAAHILAVPRLEDEHAAFLATTAALREILQGDGARRADAFASTPRARLSTAFGIRTPHSPALPTSQPAQRLGACELSRWAGPDILALDT